MVDVISTAVWKLDVMYSCTIYTLPIIVQYSNKKCKIIDLISLIDLSTPLEVQMYGCSFLFK